MKSKFLHLVFAQLLVSAAMILNLHAAETLTDTQVSQANNLASKPYGVMLSVPNYLCRNVNDDQAPTDTAKYEKWDRDHVSSPDEKNLKAVTLTAKAGTGGGVLTLEIKKGATKITCPVEGHKDTIYWKEMIKQKRYPDESDDPQPVDASNHSSLTWNLDSGEIFNEVFYIEGVENSDEKNDIQFVATLVTEGASPSVPKSTTVYEVDLDVDSYNDNGFADAGYDAAPPEGETAFEDEIEASDKLIDGVARPGKIVIGNHYADNDGDAIPDYADLKIKDHKFVPMRITLKKPFFHDNTYIELSYLESKPENSANGYTITPSEQPGGQSTYTLNKGGMRIWRKDASDRTAEDFLSTDGTYLWSELAGENNDSVTLYIEYVDKAIPAASGRKDIKVTATDGNVVCDDEVVVSLVSIDLIAHKRGTINVPGAEQPKGNGEYGYETVMMENADSENNNEGIRDCDEAPLIANKDKDDDFVKIVLYYNGPKIKGASLELKHEGMAVDAKIKASKMADPRTAVETLNSGSRLNFYDKDGILLNPATDLIIADLNNPGSGYLARILDPANNGKLILFIEGADDYGTVGPSLTPVKSYHENSTIKEAKSSAQKLGGSRLKLALEKSGQKSEAPVLVYRGGFLAYKQPKNQPGVVGTLGFWDGKGRIRQVYGGHKNEFKEDDTDWGKNLKNWDGKSGLLSGAEYNVSEGNGHIPPGWWINYERTEYSDSQDNKTTGSGNSKVIRQGSYCRWQQDDLPRNQGYEAEWVYKASNPKDKLLGEPVSVIFKYELLALSPSTQQNRVGIQLHPDGKKNGTRGCIGIQTYQECLEVKYVMRSYNNLLIKAERQ